MNNEENYIVKYPEGLDPAILKLALNQLQHYQPQIPDDLKEMHYQHDETEHMGRR